LFTDDFRWFNIGPVERRSGAGDQIPSHCVYPY
jgi:hypothetical protein